MMWGYGFDAVSWLLMGLMMLFPLLVIVGIVLLIIWAVRRGGDGYDGREDLEHWREGPAQARPGESRPDEALGIAARRFANGEITREQYDEMVSVLRR